MEVLEACIVQLREEKLTWRMESYVILKNRNVGEINELLISVFLKIEITHIMCICLD